jgi:hypothetical protein
MPSKLASWFQRPFDNVFFHNALWGFLVAAMLSLVICGITGTFDIISGIISWVIAIMILTWADLMFPKDMGAAAWTITGFAIIVCSIILGSLNALLSPTQEDRTINIVLLAVYFSWLLCIESALSANKGSIIKWLIRIVLVITCGVIPVCIAYMQNHFAQEELYGLIQSLILAAFYLFLSLARWYKKRSYPIIGKAIEIPTLLLWGILLVSFAIISVLTFIEYQHSFYSQPEELYPGVTSDSPFICSETSTASNTYSGQKVFNQLLENIESRPGLSVPEYGMLALTTGNNEWLGKFHTQLLAEAAAGRFTGPANSVKWIQYQAAQRLYFFTRVQEVFPDLFSPEEEQSIRLWFQAINKRALTVEWVDWLYAAAFAKLPEGPYENQEHGAGLLSLLEVSGFANPALTDENEKYLSSAERGWNARFRNTDDVYTYQMEWIENAYYQSLLKGNTSDRNMRLSFEWMLLQALPDGSPLVYNYPYAISSAATAYLAAELLADPEMLWWAGQSLSHVNLEDGVYPRPYPGIEKPLDMVGTAPTTGSCLLYGDSGLPNQDEGLAPDKIVFRDGWEYDSRYLMLNLRFAGWHRYKATNTITLLYQNGPMIEEITQEQHLPWLPEGRSVVRDKRIPRENLNGLIVEQTGFSQVLNLLTGMGSRFAQDPPHYAEVISFTTGAEQDISHTRLTNWQGWTHDRWVYFRHNYEPVLIADSAVGPRVQQAAITWHPASSASDDNTRFVLREDGNPVEMVLLPEGSNTCVVTSISDESIFCKKQNAESLHLLTIFLFDEWVGAQIERLPDHFIVQTDTLSVTMTLPAEYLIQE